MSWSYETDSYLQELETEILELGAEAGRPWVRLADTLFYPEGGGQPADRGWIDDVAVTDVQKTGDDVRHYLERPADPGPVKLTLDWQRRFDHMQQHTAQHLLSAIAEDRCGWRTTAFHLGSELSDIELDVAALSTQDIEKLEADIAVVIRSAHAVRPRSVSPEELAQLAVRTRGLPEDHAGPLRLVEIESVDLNTCGGTHLRSTAEIEALHLTGTERMRGGTRLYFVAGGRARTRFARHEQQNAELRRLLGVGDAEIISTVEARLKRLTALEKGQRRLQQDLARALAETLAAQAEPVLAAHYDDGEPGFLQQIGRRLLELAPRSVALLTAGQQDEGFFALAVGPELKLDVKELGSQLADILEARGGGAGQLFQGKARAVSRRDQARQHLEQALEGLGTA